MVGGGGDPAISVEIRPQMHYMSMISVQADIKIIQGLF
jgi:hypothetical protein